jgi:hypothetical protein
MRKVDFSLLQYPQLQGKMTSKNVRIVPSTASNQLILSVYHPKMSSQQFSFTKES